MQPASPSTDGHRPVTERPGSSDGVAQVTQRTMHWYFVAAASRDDAECVEAPCCGGRDLVQDAISGGWCIASCTLAAREATLLCVRTQRIKGLRESPTWLTLASVAKRSPRNPATGRGPLQCKVGSLLFEGHRHPVSRPASCPVWGRLVRCSTVEDGRR